MHAVLMPADLQPPFDGGGRSEGIHVSRIIRSIASRNGILDARQAEDLSLVEVGNGATGAWWAGLTDGDRLRISIGVAWEHWYVPHLGHVTHQPGEMQLDGVYMTHDGESLDVIHTERGDKSVLALHEIKATYKSTKTVGNLEGQWMWLAQTKSYCKALNTRLAYLHVLFLCGDYKYPITPQLRVWRIEYTQLEIDDNWSLMMSMVRHHQEQEREDMMKDTI